MHSENNYNIIWYHGFNNNSLFAIQSVLGSVSTKMEGNFQLWTIMDPVRLDLRNKFYLARNYQKCGGRNDLVMTSFIKFKPIIQNGYVPHIFGYSLRYKQSQCRIHNCPNVGLKISND